MSRTTEGHYILLSPDRRILLRREADGHMCLPDAIPEEMAADMEEGFAVGRGLFAPLLRGEYEPTGEMEWTGLRESWRLLPEEEYMGAAKAAELLFWRSQNLHCGSCGSPTLRATEISRLCPDCGREIFPSPAPAILVLVTRGEEALLVHAKNFSRPFFGLVAGFVETGESMERCVAREVEEETSLRIRNIRYFGSQTWPFPFNLMVGFTAEYESGDVRFADGELSEGGFFRRDSLPQLATPPSLARAMIDAWANRKL